MSSMYKSMGSMYNNQSGGFLNGLKNMSWATISIIAIAVVILIICGIYYYYQTTSKFSSSSVTYKHNSEGPGTDSSGRTAELMLFYVDWCPHCKTAKPEWEEVKSEYEGRTVNGYKIIFTEVNCTDENGEIEKLMNKYKIEGYPTIKMLKDGQVIEFDAKPTKSTLEKFINTVV